MIRAVVICGFCAFVGSAASAATVGSLTFDDDAWGDVAVVNAGGTPVPTFNGDPADVVDQSILTGFQLNPATSGGTPFELEISFTDNVLFNGAGYDIVIWGGTNNNALRIDTDGDPSTLGFGSGSPIEVVTPGLVAAYVWDLSDLGFADGAEVTGSLFLSGGGVFGTVWDVAALNSKPVSATPTPAPIPLPAAGWLLIAGMGGLAMMKRRQG